MTCTDIGVLHMFRQVRSTPGHMIIGHRLAGWCDGTRGVTIDSGLAVDSGWADQYGDKRPLCGNNPLQCDRALDDVDVAVVRVTCLGIVGCFKVHSPYGRFAT